MDNNLKYNDLNLPDSVNDILYQDFWIFDRLNPTLLQEVTNPVKFSSTVAIFVRKGRAVAEINLQRYEIEGPAIVIIASTDIILPIKASDDFEGAFIVMSKKFTDNIVLLMNDPPIYGFLKRQPAIKIPPHLVHDYELLFKNLQRNINDPENKKCYQTVLYTIMAFIFQTFQKCLNALDSISPSSNHITTSFLRLVQEKYKSERFLQYYADKLQITPKHLSRTVKASTGYTACEWIDRFTVLEAKVLLKSSNLNIQQIAEVLSFPSQSLFGKYFKKNVGISPKEFRNS